MTSAGRGIRALREREVEEPVFGATCRKRRRAPVVSKLGKWDTHYRNQRRTRRSDGVEWGRYSYLPLNPLSERRYAPYPETKGSVT